MSFLRCFYYINKITIHIDVDYRLCRDPNIAYIYIYPLPLRTYKQPEDIPSQKLWVFWKYFKAASSLFVNSFLLLKAVLRPFMGNSNASQQKDHM